jgi:2-methylcitrate dehydratase PrpD
MTDHTRAIARFAVSTPAADLPPDIRRQGVRSLVNWIGNPIGACRSDTVERVIAGQVDRPNGGPARLLGRGDRVGTVEAAFINCVASSIYDFDDAHLATVIHPTGPVAAALLALSERRPITGEQFLSALVVGIEVQCRLANALAVAPGEIDEGWFLTGITGPVGTAAAVGRVLGLDEQQLVWAIGIAAARAAGTRETHGSMAKNFIPAWGAEAGMRAAFLARQGVSSSERPLEGPRGVAAMFARRANLDALVDGLGERWDLVDNAFKPYPSGIVTHGAITAAEGLAQLPGFDVNAIERVELTVHPQCLKLTGLRTPRTAAEGTFSVYHWTALALLHGRASIRQFHDAAVADPTVVDLRDRIAATEDAGFAKDEADIRLFYRDGRVRRHHVAHALGSKERPLADDALTVKLHDLADGVLGTGATADVAQLCWQLETLPDASAIVTAACIAGPAAPRTTVQSVPK